MMLKRICDVVIGLAGLVLSLPILLAAGILIKADSRGPAIFKQKRVGLDGALFEIYKLRTMVDNAQKLGPSITARKDPRITQIGTLLRWLKIDELPQLWNVVRGDMSMVGPRPEVPEIAADYTEEQKKVLSVKPGIFGPNQVIGRNEVDQYPEGVDVERYYRTVILAEKLRIDLDYVARAGFLSDLMLITQGIWVTLAGSFKLRYILEGRRQLVFLLVDAALTFASYCIAFLLRFDADIPFYEATLILKLAPILLIIRLPLYIYFGLYQTLWQYAGVSEIQGIVKSVTLGSLVFLMFSLFEGHYMHPRSIFVIEAIITILFLGGFRIGSKILLGHLHQLQGAKVRRNVLIVGAGDNGEILVRELMRRPELGLRPVGFLDNDLSKRGAKIHGIKVFGDCSLIKRVAGIKKAEEVIVAVPTLSSEEMQGIFSLCREAGLRVRIARPLHPFLAERVVSMKIQGLKIEDLLGREEIVIDTSGMSDLVLGKTVLVTGGGGTIGAELCRRIADYKPGKLLVLDRSENDLYEICFELSNFSSDIHVRPFLMDITHEEKLREVFSQERPHIVFHTAAYKHVPVMEANVREAVRNNVLGTRLLCDMALEYDAQRFVFISTDKAVNATSVMGMTKRVAELSVQGRKGKGKTRFITVRFGNVLGSRGSVVPILLRQIELGGPLTVTDPGMKRYFMGLTESVMLILQAVLLGRGGEIFLLEMGRPVKIVDLAQLLLYYAGFTPDEMKIRYIGLRPGEKLEETLVGEGETVDPTTHEKIRVLRPVPFDADRIEEQIGELIRLVDQGESEEVLKAALQNLIVTVAVR